MRSFLITRAAREDLKNIAVYTQKAWGATQRGIYLRGLDATFNFLAGNPHAGMACDYITAGLRKRPHEQHVVFYECQDETIVVVRVLHRSMDVESHIREA